MGDVSCYMGAPGSGAPTGGSGGGGGTGGGYDSGGGGGGGFNYQREYDYGSELLFSVPHF